MKRALLVGVAIASVCVLGARIARADTYNVSATVPYDTPSTASTFGGSFDGLASPTRAVALSGTCQYVYPASIVAIYRLGVLMASTACTVTNTYQLDVTLVDGQNVLLARTYNMNGLYGPDSVSITVSYTPPAVPLPQTPPQVATQDAPSTLSIVTQAPFHVVDAKHTTVQVSVLVDGGATPYTIELNWGDGTTESKQVSASGTYTFEHEYEKPATYQARARVTDVLGVSREQVFAVVAPGALAESVSKPISTGAATPINFTPYYVAGGVVVTLISGIAIGIALSGPAGHVGVSSTAGVRKHALRRAAKPRTKAGRKK